MTPTTAAERSEIRTMARELARRELQPRAASLDAGAQDALAECWRLLVELGLDRMLLDEQHGGAGLGVDDLLATIEELAVGDGGIAMCVLLCNAALATLDDEQLAEVPWGARWTLVPATMGREVTVSAERSTVASSALSALTALTDSWCSSTDLRLWRGRSMPAQPVCGSSATSRRWACARRPPPHSSWQKSIACLPPAPGSALQGVRPPRTAQTAPPTGRRVPARR